MTFRPVALLPGGWKIGYRVSPVLYLMYSEMPVFLREADGKEMSPEEVAVSESGRYVFHHVKKWLDFADRQKGMSTTPEWRTVDKARLAMQVKLEEVGAMTSDLLQNEVSGKA